MLKVHSICLPPNCRQITLHDRVSKLLESFEWSDCSFLVGSETVKAHKLILAISSPVFKVMLYGPMAEGKQIIVSDIEPHVFQLLLDFIYKDKVSIDSLENACGLLYAAKKYMFPYLTEICLKYIEDSVSIRNVLSVFNFSEWIQEESLTAYCLNLICKHAEVIFAENLDHLSCSALQIVLQQQSINICEKDLIQLLFQWAHNECVERDLPTSDENKRIVITEAGALGSLRFGTLGLDDINWLSSTNIFTENELMVIKTYLCNKILGKTNSVQNKPNEFTKSNSEVSTQKSLQTVSNFSNLNFSTVPRNVLKLDWSFCCRPVLRTAYPLIIDDITQSIRARIKCQKTVFVNSFLIPTRQSPEVTFTNEFLALYLENITIVINNDTNVSEMTTDFTGMVDYNTAVHVDLPKPFILNEEEWYTVIFSWPGKKTQSYRYPLCHRSPTTCNAEAVFTFDDEFSNMMYNGSFLEGLKFCI